MLSKAVASHLRRRLQITAHHLCPQSHLRRPDRRLCHLERRSRSALGTELSSKSSHTGDEFVATVTSSVKVKGTPLIPAGSTIHGVVTEAKSAGKFKGEADLLISAHSIVI